MTNPPLKNESNEGLWVKLEDVEDALILPTSNSEVIALLRKDAITLPNVPSVNGLHEEE